MEKLNSSYPKYAWFDWFDILTSVWAQWQTRRSVTYFSPQTDERTQQVRSLMDTQPSTKGIFAYICYKLTSRSLSEDKIAVITFLNSWQLFTVYVVIGNSIYQRRSHVWSQYAPNTSTRAGCRDANISKLSWKQFSCVHIDQWKRNGD